MTVSNSRSYRASMAKSLSKLANRFIVTVASQLCDGNFAFDNDQVYTIYSRRNV